MRCVIVIENTKDTDDARLESAMVSCPSTEASLWKEVEMAVQEEVAKASPGPGVRPIKFALHIVVQGVRPIPRW